MKEIENLYLDELEQREFILLSMFITLMEKFGEFPFDDYTPTEKEKVIEILEMLGYNKNIVFDDKIVVGKE